MKLKNNNKSKSNKQKLYSKLNFKINNKLNNKTREKFEDENNNEDNKVGATTFEEIVDMISVSPSAKDKESVTYQDQLTDYFFLVLKYAFLVGLLCLNFLGLSISLNCNADQELSQRILSAIFAFFFFFLLF